MQSPSAYEAHAPPRTVPHAAPRIRIRIGIRVRYEAHAAPGRGSIAHAPGRGSIAHTDNTM